MSEFQQRVKAIGDDSIAPTLLINYGAWLRMQAYVLACPAEINGFAYVSQLNANTFVITEPDDVFITRQTVTGHSANVDGADFARATADAVASDRLDQLRVQWHSHVWGEAYHSSTDMESIANFGNAGMTWWISVVTNKLGEIVARMDQFRPFRVGAAMQVRIVHQIAPEIIANSELEIAELVTIVQPKKKGTRYDHS